MNEAATDRLAGFIERFLSELAAGNFSPHTIDNYRRDLKELERFCASVGIEDWGKLDEQHLRLFAARQHSAGLAPRSIQRRLSAARSFFNFLIRGKSLPNNPAVDVRAPKGAKRLPHTIDADQMARLLDFRTDDTLSARDKAIMELFYSSGLRLQELVSLNLENLDLADCTVRVTGKGQKERIVPVGRYALDAINEWLLQRAMLPVGATPAVFVGSTGRRLTCRAVQKRVDIWAKRQGLNVKMHPHLFRHSFATHLLESSGNLRGVQELLGHANIGTTQIYTHLDFQHLARIYDASHPRARKKA